ncbi:RICIN domain-containing protein [Dactylosporangium sucinum]|uniref:Ricin B lectin domain-containing protein n=1 Tax=Dactylosporangium sucinum TaxID=1424081 RepID=A0A917TKZ8_9ACTN|nr:RICIN domain-containing protein [Dactylosporangium sucinum]GGM27026.1 hypothetical protein GCM10007977_030270 [Dactylosporangium sucinum]
MIFRHVPPNPSGNAFADATIFGGPCLLIDRRWGLALDATREPGERTRPVLWTPHAAPWQQWRIQRAGGGTVRIASEHGGLVLTTDDPAGDRSWVWLATDEGHDHQRWRLAPTDDRVACIIEAKRSAHALDARTDTKVPAVEPDGSVADPTPPILYSTHWRPWQQWLILRVPLGTDHTSG